MKTILLVVAFIFVCSNFSFSQCVSPCQSTWSLPVPGTITMPGFPLCIINYEYKTRVCNGEIEVVINNFYFSTILNDPNDPCRAFRTWLYDPLAANINVDAVLRAIQNKIVAELFDADYNALPPLQKYLLECPNHKKNFVFYIAQCTKICVYDDQANGMSLVTKKACNGGPCCKITYEICRNTLTGLNVVTTTMVEESPGLTCWDDIEYPCDATYTVPGITIGGGSPVVLPISFIVNCSASCE